MKRLAQITVLVLVAGLVVGCAATRGRSDAPEESGFLRDYSKLEPRPNFEAHEVYVNPKAVWVKYDSIQLDSVTLWANEDSGRLTDEEKQMLTDTLYSALHEQLGREFFLVEQAGPTTIRLRAALTEEKGANVPARTISTILPQALLLGWAVGVSADTAVTVGSATIEVELLDSVTGTRLAAAVDNRAGTKDITSGRTFSKWGDVKAACDFWSQRVTGALVKMGVRRKV